MENQLDTLVYIVCLFLQPGQNYKESEQEDNGIINSFLQENG